MKKTISKLIAAGMALIISVVMIVTITYAWTTLSTAPTAEGIQVTIGGGNTILLAPNISETVDGTVCHYPGAFQDTLVFSKYKSYDYLKQINSLSPVSTADGINWFVPSYYSISDSEVKNGEAAVGDVKPFSSFTQDTELDYANLSGEESSEGHYMYLDFWVVSPQSEYTLRVSSGDKNSGSYLIELPAAKETESGYALEETKGSFSASARVGFLVNTDYTPEQSVTRYKQSYGYLREYQKLCGSYQEKGAYPYHGSYRFTVYEPNADLHPEGEGGCYIPTQPVGISGNTVGLLNIQDRVTAQLKNSWSEKNSNNLTLSEVFDVATVGKNIKTAKEAENELYDNYLQGQLSPYVKRGRFVKSTAALYEKCSDDNKADAAELASLQTAGATDDTYIVKLEKNVPQRIRMFVWIEGQDIDCTATEEAQRFALSIELAGSNQG